MSTEARIRPSDLRPPDWADPVVVAERVYGNATAKANYIPTGAKIEAGQLVAYHILRGEVLPHTTLRALAAAMARRRPIRPTDWPGVDEAVEAARRATAAPQFDDPNRWSVGKDHRAVVLDVARWLSEQGMVLHGPIFHYVCITLDLTNLDGMLREKVAESILPKPTRFTTEWAHDDEGELVVRAVPIGTDTRYGLRGSESAYRKSIEIEAAARIVRGRPDKQVLSYERLTDKLMKAGEAVEGPATVGRWGASGEWQQAADSRARHIIRNAIDLEALGVLSAEELAERVRVDVRVVRAWRGELSDDEVAQLAGVEPKAVKAWRREDSPWQDRVDARREQFLMFKATSDGKKPLSVMKRHEQLASRARTPDSTS